MAKFEDVRLWATLQDVAAELDVSESFLRREIKAGNIDHTKFGANYRFKREWIDAYTMKKAGSGIQPQE